MPGGWLLRQRAAADRSDHPYAPIAEARADGVLIAKAGKPQFAIAGSDDEIVRYTTSEGGSIRIRIVEGKVESIEQTPPKTASTPVPNPPADPVK